MGRLKLKRRANGLTGPNVPTEPFERCEIIIEKRPTDDWLLLNKAALDRGDVVEPDDEDMFVGLNVYGFYVIPDALTPPSLWKQGRTLMLTLTEVSYVEWRAECLADIDRKRAPETPEEHKAELGEIGDAAIAAHRAQRTEGCACSLAHIGAGPSPLIDRSDSYADRLDAYVSARPWWRRVLGI